MHNKVKIYIALLISAVLIVIDQITKAAVVSKLALYEYKEVISKFFFIHYVRNTGSAFSFLADKSWGIYVLSAISLIMAFVILVLTIMAVSKNYKWIASSGILLFSGAIGNLIDRIKLHYVVDFLRFDFGSYTFPIFNVADICAVCGTILLIIVMLFNSKETDGFIESLNFKKENHDTESDK